MIRKLTVLSLLALSFSACIETHSERDNTRGPTPPRKPYSFKTPENIHYDEAIYFLTDGGDGNPNTLETGLLAKLGIQERATKDYMAMAYSLAKRFAHLSNLSYKLNAQSAPVPESDLVKWYYIAFECLDVLKQVQIRAQTAGTANDIFSNAKARTLFANALPGFQAGKKPTNFLRARFLMLASHLAEVESQAGKESHSTVNMESEVKNFQPLGFGMTIVLNENRDWKALLELGDETYSKSADANQKDVTDRALPLLAKELSAIAVDDTSDWAEELRRDDDLFMGWR